MARLLLVDDDEDQLVLHRLILAHHGHEVQVAENDPRCGSWWQSSHLPKAMPASFIRGSTRLPDWKRGWHF